MSSKLKSILNLKNKTTLFVGIGNVLKSDDGVGVAISDGIVETENVKKLTVEVSIENYIGKINSIKHNILVLIDCVDFKKEPGYYNLVNIDEIVDRTTNTHNISLQKLSELFKAPQIMILGVQPLKINFGEEISEEIQNTALNIIELINSSNN